MKQKEFSKLSNEKTIVIKHADNGEVVANLSTGHYQSMIMQHLLDENTYKKLDSCTDNKTQTNLSRLPRQNKICFIEPELKFPHDKQH